MITIRLKHENNTISVKRVTRNVTLNRVGRRGPPGEKGDPGDPADTLVSSVNGQQGAVVLNTSDVSESGNLYYTEGRVSANTNVAANTAARHTHANKTILDNTTASFTSADQTKLDGIDSGATANSTDAQLRDRATHTGVQAISTVTDLQTTLDSKTTTSYVDDAIDNIDFPVDSVNGETGVVILDKTDLGLSNVDNTSDVNKPVSTAQQTQLDGKVNGTTTLTVGTTEPLSPSVGDLWVDTN